MLGDLSSFEEISEALKAERACWETYLDYFDIIEGPGPNGAAANCFTRHTQVIYGMRGEVLVLTGRDEYAAFLEGCDTFYQMLADVARHPRFTWSNGILRLTKVISWQWLAANAQHGKQRPADFVAVGHTEDEFACVDSRLISSRIVGPAAGATAIGALP
ncbi:hypothetical protein ACVIHH_003698 [Bradyrhizobium sp. USDA 4518]